MAAKQAVLLRHGQTEWNLKGYWQGQSDIPLNETGRGQASLAARLLRDTYSDVGRIVSSDLQRAHTTADKAAHELGLAAGHDTALPIITEKRFREFNSGKLEGKHRSEIDKEFAHNLKRFRDGEDVPIGETGERPSEVAARVSEGFHEHAAATPDDTTLLAVGHGGAWRLLVYSLIGMTGDWRGLWVLRNCHWAVLRPARGDHWEIHAWNIGAEVPAI